MAAQVRLLIKKHTDRGERDIEGVTGKVVKDIIAAGDAEDLLLGLVRSQVSTMISALRRDDEEKWEAAERAYNAAERRGHHSDDIRNTLAAQRQRVVKLEFHAPGFGYVTWGAALEIHHAAAEETSRKTSAAHARDADRHARARREIAAAGVRCLQDIPGFLEETWLAEAA